MQLQAELGMLGLSGLGQATHRIRCSPKNLCQDYDYDSMDAASDTDVGYDKIGYGDDPSIQSTFEANILDCQVMLFFEHGPQSILMILNVSHQQWQILYGIFMSYYAFMCFLCNLNCWISWIRHRCDLAVVCLKVFADAIGQSAKRCITGSWGSDIWRTERIGVGVLWHCHLSMTRVTRMVISYNL